MTRRLFQILCLLLSRLGLPAAAQPATGTPPQFVVAQDGSGNFRTVQEAINAVPDFRKKVTTIFIKNGIYQEKLVLAGCKTMVRLLGEDREKTVLTYDDYNAKKNVFGEDKGTSGSASCYLYGNDFSAENLTFQNSAGPVGQAVAAWVAGDRSRFKNCRFLGFQDTLYTFGYGRQYYKDCYIEGTTDFIFGSSTAFFEDCTIFCKPDGQFIAAASTPDTAQYGYVFQHCKIVGNAPAGSVFLGRPWRPYAKTVYLSCELGAVIVPAGWDLWGKESNQKTAYYGEYQSTGPGASATGRAMWAHPLTTEQAHQYTREKVLRDWHPED